MDRVTCCSARGLLIWSKRLCTCQGSMTYWCFRAGNPAQPVWPVSACWHRLSNVRLESWHVWYYYLWKNLWMALLFIISIQELCGNAGLYEWISQVFLWVWYCNLGSVDRHKKLRSSHCWRWWPWWCLTLLKGFGETWWRLRLKGSIIWSRVMSLLSDW